MPAIYVRTYPFPCDPSFYNIMTYLPRGISTPCLYGIPEDTAKPRVSPIGVRRYLPYLLPLTSFHLALALSQCPFPRCVCVCIRM